MASNGLSARRSTLKRPAVCKNEIRKICGRCIARFLNDAVHASPGAVFSIPAIIECDPEPQDTTFNINVLEPFANFPPPASILVNNATDLNLVAPLLPGPQPLNIVFKNSTRCSYPAFVTVVVDPF